MFDSITKYGVTGCALKQELQRFQAVNPRRFADNKLGYIDDRSFGGRPGTIVMAPPLQTVINQAKQTCSDGRVIYLSPQGQPFTQQRAAGLAKSENLILLCGCYEGIDGRLLQGSVDEKISVGDFVVSGDELPAMTLMDAALWLILGVLGDIQSAERDSFSGGLLGCPHYTKPLGFQGMSVSDVLRSGSHGLIAGRWLKQPLQRTLERHSDSLEGRGLIPKRSRLLKETLQE